ncbi:MAG: aspartate carbamoyltransferase [Deltaproteobacteria bacterium]|nr:MAG: aspartate carbamoyltransferase [Deltaproteobacteria bacterium]PIE74931.1 MAG: aspartate carbamoyltransferase [Deltaproteobacteria bacterium]
MKFEKKSILDIKSLSPEEIQFILDTAFSMKEINKRPVKKVPALRGRTIVLFFQEPSTRTKLSFDLAAKRLSADCISLSTSSSSMQKGETLLDTARTIEAMNPDILVMRHSMSGAPHYLSNYLGCSIINGGDGRHAHPSQALLDMMTIKEKKKTFKNLEIAIIGDISNSRVARSNLHGFSKMGCKTSVFGPPSMIPPGISKEFNCIVADSMEDAIGNADVVMMLRIQKERQGANLFSSEREYSKFFGLDKSLLKYAKKDVIVMHPGPVNRGVELNPDLADSDVSVINEQVTNGVALRMALFYLVSGGVKNVDSD